MNNMFSGAELQGSGSASQNLAITITTFNYEDTPISFRNDDGSVMVNATQMAKRFGKRPIDWLNLPSTKEFLNELTEVRKSNNAINQLVTTKRGGLDLSAQGTWLHEDVALEFARWLSPKFAIWCNDRIKELLTQGVTTIANDDETILRAIKVLERRVDEARALVAQKDNLIEQKNAVIGDQAETIEEQAVTIAQLQPKANVFDEIVLSDGTYTATQLAKEFGYPTVRDFYNKLTERRILYQQSGTYMPYKDWTGKDLFAWRTRRIKHKDGNIEVKTYLVFTEKFRAAILYNRHKRALESL
ncbi:MAG: KilA-N domain-containing protein [Clostridia bacterium]|nr:KilA-N domain-containing protein [Clostridia bacterium]